MKKIEIGDLRQRITFQEPVEADDGYKGKTVSWRDIVTVWAQVDPLSGREFFYAHQIKNEVSHRVRMRYRKDITVKMRIKLSEERHLAIESIIDLEERRQFLEVLCREEK